MIYLDAIQLCAIAFLVIWACSAATVTRSGRYGFCEVIATSIIMTIAISGALLIAGFSLFAAFGGFAK